MGCACAGAAIEPSANVVSVNGVVISRDVISRETQHHPAAIPAEAWRDAVRALVIRQLLLEEAGRLQIEPTPAVDQEGRRETDDEAIVRQLIDAEVKTPTPDEASCRRYYEQNRKRFRSADLFEADHILFAAAPSDPAARERAKSETTATIAVLQAEPHRFGDFAKARSACPSGREGGNLGQITRGATTEEFEKALFALQQGRMTAEPVETRFGFHIIRLRRRIEGRDLPFEAVRERIASYLAESVERRALAQYVSLLAGAANITGVDLVSD
jgi:peptidyl-prolyl cis-trans isomerase C